MAHEARRRWAEWGKGHGLIYFGSVRSEYSAQELEAKLDFLGIWYITESEFCLLGIEKEETVCLRSVSLGRFGLMVLAGALIFSAVIPTASIMPAKAAPLKAGLVVTEAGIADQSWNWLAYQGLQRAESDMDVIGTVYTPVDSGDYENKVLQCVIDGNSLCIGTAFPFIDPMINAANANPDIYFAVLDTRQETVPANFRPISFAEDEAGYLAGTLAGLITASGTIGAIGGMEILPVIYFLDGYRNAAPCINPAVQVLYTYAGTFTDPNLGAVIAQSQMAQGADIIFTAAGPTGSGGLLYASQNGAWGIGVDVDEYYSTFGGGTVAGSDRLLTSAMKRLDNGVYFTIKDVLTGDFTPGQVHYTLADGGVGLAPYHETEGSIPDTVRGMLNRVKIGLLSGLIDPLGACPTSLPAYLYLPEIVRSP